MAVLMLDYEMLDAEANRLMQEGSVMEDCIRNITNIVNALPDIWQADTGRMYVQKYQQLQPGLEQTIALIDDMVTQMKQIAANFQDTDAGMASQMG